MAKYLDDDGLLYFWQKIKNLFALKTDVPSASSTSPKANGTAAVGTEAAWAHGDHVHPTDTTRAPLASPTFTGTPKAPTAAAGTNTTQIATTAFVKSAIDTLDTGVTSVAGKTGAVTLDKSDVGLGNVDNTADANKTVDKANTLVTARTIDGVSFDGSAVINHSLTGITVDNSSTKCLITASKNGFVRAQGARFVISFAASVTLSNKPIYFNINSTGEWPAYYPMSTALMGEKLTAGRTYEFVGTSSGYVLVGELDTTYSAATTSVDGLMSSSDKTKLDGIETGANAYTHPTYDAASAAAVKVGRDATGHVVIGDTLTASDVGASATGHKHAAGDITSGTLGVARGGTGASTLGAGVVYHTSSGTGALSIATAANIVSAIGNTAVNRATADASGNNISDTYAKKTDVAGVYKYKGSVATESALPASPATGDVYNIESASSYGAAGANVAWNGTAWDSLGEIFTIASITNAEIDAIIAS